MDIEKYNSLKATLQVLTEEREKAFKQADMAEQKLKQIALQHREAEKEFYMFIKEDLHNGTE